MPMVYTLTSKSGAQALENLTTNGSANTTNDVAFIKPGATRASSILALRVQGKGAGLTALSGIAFRLVQWTSTSSASTGATSVTITPVDNRATAAAASAGVTSTASSTITVGTGGPSVAVACGCGASGPGGWVAPNPDAMPTLDGGANKSHDVQSASGTTSLSYEFAMDTQES